VSIGIARINAYIYSLIVFLLIAILFKEQFYYVYYQSTEEECVKVGKVCVSLKKGWYRNYSQDIVAALNKNESYNSVDDVVSLNYMDNIYKSSLFSSGKVKTMLIVFQSDLTIVMKNLNELESESISLVWGDATITSSKVLNIDQNRAIIQNYNLILFFDELKDLNGINGVSIQ